MNIIYNVTVNVEKAIADEWLQWMTEKHIDDVMRTGLFIEHHIFRLIGDEQSGGVTYAVQYRMESMAHYEKYRDEFAPALQAEVKALYGDRFTAFRSLLEVVK
jgi:hypothetical protein